MNKETVAGLQIYVDPLQGNDGNTGSLQCPLLTIEGAKRRVRELASAMKGDITVNLRKGVYRPTWHTRSVPLFNLFGETGEYYPLRISSLAFGEEDSGRNGYKVIYRSNPGEQAVISGGCIIDGWTCCDESRRIYRALVGSLDTRQLYINGRRAVRAKSKQGFVGHTEYDSECHLTGGPAYITDDPAPCAWKHPQGVELVYPNSFTMSRCTVDRVETMGNKTAIYMKQPGWHYITHKYGTSAKLPVWFENDRSLLDTPGEWCLDRREGALYYIPLPEEDMSTAEAIVPQIDVLLSVKGESASRKAGHLSFRGIAFEYAGWLRPNYVNGHCDSQNNYIRESIGQQYDSDHQSDAVVEIEYADHVTLEDCRFTKLGITAIRLTKSSSHNLIRGCEIADVSGGGISIGDPEFRNPENRRNYLPPEEEMISDNRIVCNYIHDIALEYMSATAISAAFTRNTEISGNEICRVPYSGVHIGYGWDVPDITCTSGMHISRNVVDTFMMRLYDGGGMYFIGATGGTPEHPNRISGNFIRNQVEPKYGGFYFDEGSSDWQADNNVFENTELWCNISGISRKLHDIAIADTYLTDGYSYFNPSLGQQRVSIEPPQTFPGKNWPEHVEELIRQAGLPPEYAHLRPDYYVLGELVPEREHLVLAMGGEADFRVTARTVRGVRIGQLPEQSTLYLSDNEGIAAVDRQGRVRGIAPGLCRITATVELDGVRKSAEIEAYINDEVVQRELVANVDALLPGASQQVELVSRTGLGRSYGEEGAVFRSDRPEILRVDQEGRMTAVSPGTAVIRAFVREDVREAEACLTIRVCSGAEPSGRLIRDPAYWSASPDLGISNGDGWLRVSTEGGIGTAVYRGRPYGDGLMRFGLLLEAADNELVCLYLRGQEPSGRVFDSGNAGYVVVIGPQGIELHRFRDRQRTQLYGDVFPFPSLAGGAIPNTFIHSGRQCGVELGAINEMDGVWLVMRVDGRVVFDVVDRWEGNIREPGYFGLTVTRGKLTLREQEDSGSAFLIGYRS